MEKSITGSNIGNYVYLVFKIAILLVCILGLVNPPQIKAVTTCASLGLKSPNIAVLGSSFSQSFYKLFCARNESRHGSNGGKCYQQTLVCSNGNYPTSGRAECASADCFDCYNQEVAPTICFSPTPIPSSTTVSLPSSTPYEQCQKRGRAGEQCGVAEDKFVKFMECNSGYRCTCGDLPNRDPINYPILIKDNSCTPTPPASPSTVPPRASTTIPQPISPSLQPTISQLTACEGIYGTKLSSATCGLGAVSLQYNECYKGWHCICTDKYSYPIAIQDSYCASPTPKPTDPLPPSNIQSPIPTQEDPPTPQERCESNNSKWEDKYSCKYGQVDVPYQITCYKGLKCKCDDARGVSYPIMAPDSDCPSETATALTCDYKNRLTPIIQAYESGNYKDAYSGMRKNFLFYGTQITTGEYACYIPQARKVDTYCAYLGLPTTDNRFLGCTCRSLIDGMLRLAGNNADDFDYSIMNTLPICSDAIAAMRNTP